MMLRLTGDLPYPSYRGIIGLPRKQRLVIFSTETHNIAGGNRLLGYTRALSDNKTTADLIRFLFPSDRLNTL